MKKKRRAVIGDDTREVAIYARKSKITNKGDSIGVQIKQSGDYAINQLNLDDDHEFKVYQDEGLSGYYADRPDFQRLLHDIDKGKIRAVACYKLDRISRKTSDLMRLLEFLEKHNVTLLVCSNNINTQISTSKIIIQVLAIIAEFERDILTERIQDNLLELSKDGRWMGGTLPTGFDMKRLSTGTGRSKNGRSMLIPLEEERELVEQIFKTFLETRGVHPTRVVLDQAGYKTRNGLALRDRSISDILKNPVYCVADKKSYEYFKEKGANVNGDLESFDGVHGLSGYSKTIQYIEEDEESTFFNPKFVRGVERKPVNEWVISVGKHEGYIPSEKWIEAQQVLEEIAERYNRPHRRTNALLSGLVYCPKCGNRLKVVSESNRWENGKPRFKYVCAGFRQGICDFKAVSGVRLDELIVDNLGKVCDCNNEGYNNIFNSVIKLNKSAETEDYEYKQVVAKIESLKKGIENQVRNMREADDLIKRFIQDDITSMSNELQEQEEILARLKDEDSASDQITQDLESARQQMLHFKKMADNSTPDQIVTMIHKFVDRIYIVTEDGVSRCHVFIKGGDGKYPDIVGPSDYIGFVALLAAVPYFLNNMCDCEPYREQLPFLCRRPDESGVPPSDD